MLSGVMMAIWAGKSLMRGRVNKRGIVREGTDGTNGIPCGCCCRLKPCRA